MTPDEMAQELAGEKTVWQERADEARTALEAARVRLLSADRTEAAEVVAGFMRDRTALDQCAALYRVAPGEWQGWIAVAASIRGMSQPVSSLDKMVRARLSEQASASRPPSTLRIAEGGDQYVAPDCVPDGWQAPNGWRVTPSGVWREKDDTIERVATRPVWVIGYLRDVDGNGYSVRLAWVEVDRTVATSVVAAVVCAEARSLTALAAEGLPVTSASARHLSVFIDAALEQNRDILSVERVAGRLGWMPDGGFLLGREYVGPADTVVQLSASPGLEQVASGYSTQGTWEGWIDEVVTPGRDAPMLWLGIYNAVASVLIEPLGLGDNWAMDRSGETSRGKSTVGRAAYSVWADPRRRPSWKTTPVGIEATAALLRHLPLSLDDSKKARSGDDVAAVVYMHSGGVGKLRGAPGGAGRGVGLQVTERWRSSLDSDGEQALTSFTADAGARARVLCLRGAPLRDGEVATVIGLGAEAHHGHLGRRVLRHLLIPGVLDRWRESWPEVHQFWRSKLGPFGAVPGRLARVVAALDLARCICEEVGLPAAPCAPLDLAADSACGAAADADMPAEALRAVYEEAVARPTSFWGRHEVTQGDEPKVPHTGWLGAWARGDRWTHLDIRTNVVRDALKRGGFDPGVVDRWRERGWLECHAGMKSRAKSWIDGANVNVYRLTRAGIDAALG